MTFEFSNRFLFIIFQTYNINEVPNFQIDFSLNFQTDFPSSQVEQGYKFRNSNRLQVPIFKPISVSDFQTDLQIFKRVDNDE